MYKRQVTGIAGYTLIFTSHELNLVAHQPFESTEMCIRDRGCADLYGAKALRATMGSVFRVPVKRAGNLERELEEMKARGYAVAATELGGDDFYAGCPRTRAVLVIGSEGHGVSSAVRRVATHHLALPMRGGAESLNAAVAAGIMIYEMARSV